MTSYGDRALVTLLSLTVAAGAAGCLSRDIAPADPSTQSGVLEEIQQTGTTKVDILFMVDNSNSMSEEQAVLAKQVPSLVRELISPSDPNQPRAEDLHIGIVTSDMGTAGYTIQTCDNPMSGDNGVLQNLDRGFSGHACEPSYSAPDCSDAECPWLAHSEAHPDDDPANMPIWDDFGCVAVLGTGGCGFEQQLEASLVALTVQTGPGMPNEGFLRDDALLAIIYVTDEEDCSTGEGEMFNPNRDDLGGLNTRCALHPEMQYDVVSRYHDGFMALVDNDPNRIVVAAITGIPVDGRWEPGDPLDQLAELKVIDPERPNEMLTSCDTAMGRAYAPVRIVELIYSFGNNGILQSICSADWTPAMTAITRMIRDKIGGVCVGRPLASTDPGTCRVIEMLTDDRACPNAPSDPSGFDLQARPHDVWRLDLGVVEEEGFDGQPRARRRCEILPADYDGDGCPDGSSVCPPDGEEYLEGLQGWFYDDTNPECPFGQVRFTQVDVTEDRSDVRFECLTALCPVRRQCAGAAASEQFSCDGDDDCPGGVCVSHISADVCGTDDAGGPLACRRCSPTLGATCSTMDGLPEEVRAEPLIGAGGCCAEGFHCESDACVPDRTTDCF